MSSNLDQLKALTTQLSGIESEYKGFFQVAPDMFAVLTWEPGTLRKDLTFSRANNVWTDVLGWTPEEMTTKPYYDLIHPEDRNDDGDEAIEDVQNWDAPETLAKLKAAEAKAHAAGIKWDFNPNADVQLSAYTQRWRAKDGSYRFISWRASFNLQRRQAYIVGRDISDSVTGTETLHIKRHILRNVAEDYLNDAIRDLTLSKERLEEVIKIMDKEIQNAKEAGFDDPRTLEHPEHPTHEGATGTSETAEKPSTVQEKQDARGDKQDALGVRQDALGVRQDALGVRQEERGDKQDARSIRQEERDAGQNERDVGQNTREYSQNRRKSTQDKREGFQNERENELNRREEEVGE